MAKRNPDKSALLPPEGNAFDLAFEPLIEIKGATTTRISPLEMLMRRLYREALEGNAPAIRTMLSIARENAKARADAEGPKRTKVIYDQGTAIVPATPALRLLDIARLIGFGDRLVLAPWAAALVRQRVSGQVLMDHAHYLCGDDDDGNGGDISAPAPYDLHEDPDYHIPPEARSPQATRFRKGRSGNPAGRPPRKRVEVPFGGFLQEPVIVKIDGQERTVSRLEALIYHLQVKALNGDAKIARLLVDAGVSEQLARWRRRPEVVRVVYEDEYRLGGDTFTHCLQELRVLNRRTRKHALLEPWIVEAALGRLAPDALDEEEQAVVVRSTSTPHKVHWPDWWSPTLRIRQRLGRRQPRVRTLRSGDGAW